MTTIDTDELSVRAEDAIADNGYEAERGDCASVALHLLVFTELEGIEGLEDGELLLCHGQPIGQGPQNYGRRFFHAWIETDTDGDEVVIDYGSHRRFILSRDDYYKAGHIDPDEVVRYTYSEAISEVEHSGHCGPWPLDRFPPDEEI